MENILIGTLITVIIVLLVQGRRMHRVEAALKHLVAVTNDMRTFGYVSELLVQVGKAFPMGIIDYIPPKSLGGLHAFQVAIGDRVVQVDVKTPSEFVLVWRNALGQRQVQTVMPSLYQAPENASIRNELFRQMRVHLYSGGVSEFIPRNKTAD